MESPAPSLPFPKPVGQDASQTSSPEAEPVETSAELARPALRRRPAVRVPEKPDLKPVRPARKIDAVMPLFVPEAKKPAIVAEPKLAAQDPVSEAGGTSPDKIQRIIDSAVARQSVVPVAGVETASLSSGLEVEHEDKLILLSRILSGLIDLLIIGLCTGAFILAADVFSGIDIIDNVSKFYYGALLLAIYFVYSAFFLGTANQTVGMMIKDLRIVGSEGGRPRMSHILGRCAAYLISWLSLGIGLLWAAFDRNALCFHDKLSHTRVVRL